MPRIPDSYEVGTRAVVSRQQPLQARILQHSGGINVSGGQLDPRIGRYDAIQLNAPIDRTDPTQVGNAISAFGDAILNTSLRMAEMDAVTEAKRAEISLKTKINEVLYDSDEALFTKSGKAFLDSTSAAKQAINEEYKRLTESMGERAKSHFVLEGLEYQNNAFASIATSSASHRRQYIEDTFEAYYSQTMSDIGQAYTNPEKAIDLINKFKDKLAIEFPGPDGRLKQAKADNDAITALIHQATADKNYDLANTYLDYGQELAKQAASDPESGTGVALETITKAQEHITASINQDMDRQEMLDNRMESHAREVRTRKMQENLRQYTLADPATKAAMTAKWMQDLATAGTNAKGTELIVDDLFDIMRVTKSMDGDSGKDGSKDLMAYYKANWENHAIRLNTILADTRLTSADRESLVAWFTVKQNSETNNYRKIAEETIKAHTEQAESGPGGFGVDQKQRMLTDQFLNIYEERMYRGMQKLNESDIPDGDKPTTIRAMHTKVLDSLIPQFQKMAPGLDTQRMPELYRGMYFDKSKDPVVQKQTMEEVVLMDYEAGVIGEEEAQAQLDMIEATHKTLRQ